MKIGSREFALEGNTYIMGILNVTPDSFSDGGAYNQLDKAMERVSQMIEDGADIIDVGGESTRPNYVEVPEEEEIQRVVPVIRAIKERHGVPISIDTCKAKVARAALEAGADMVNDIWGLKYDPDMALAIKEYGVPVCIMHNHKTGAYQDFLEEAMAGLEESLEIARKAGIPREKIILDPGVGFGKSYEQNLECIGRLEEFARFGLPVLLGVSRKSVIGLTLGLPVGEREEGTMAISVMAVMKGCQFIRVHNVKGNVRAVRMAQAVLRGGAAGGQRWTK